MNDQPELDNVQREHDLKESKETIKRILGTDGELLARWKPAPAIFKEYGYVDGRDRTDADFQDSEEHPEINTIEKYLVTRAHLNFSRKDPSQRRKEKVWIINSLAEYYVKQGYHVYGEKPDSAGYGGGSGASKNEVVDAVIKALRGAIRESYIRQNIDPKYTQSYTKKEPKLEPPLSFVSVESEAINAIGVDKVEMLKVEAVKEALEKPEIIEKIIQKPEVAKKAIERHYGFSPPIMEPPKPMPKPSPIEVEQIQKAVEQTRQQIQVKKSEPQMQERAKWFRTWTALGNVIAVIDEIYCPIDNNPARTHLVFKCHPDLSLEEIYELVKEKLEQ